MGSLNTCSHRGNNNQTPQAPSVKGGVLRAVFLWVSALIFRDRRQWHGSKQGGSSTVHYLLTFAGSPIAPAELFPWNLSHLALKGLGWLFQTSRVYGKPKFQLYFLMYLNTIALQCPILLGFILQVLLVV